MTKIEGILGIPNYQCFKTKDFFYYAYKIVLYFSYNHEISFLNFDFFKENLAIFCSLILPTQILSGDCKNLQENNKTPNQKISSKRKQKI